jgi:3-hydroxybutyryl-CoA dehydrogenase
MGQGLAETIATANHHVLLFDVSQEKAEQGLQKIGESIDREISRWGLTKSDKKAILARIKMGRDINEVAGAEVVLEAVPEDLKIKKELFAKLATICSSETIFVTNTSTLSISEIASQAANPDRVIGMHFLNPVTKIPVVEIVKGLSTSAATFDRAVQLAEMLNKKWITVNEYPGYVTTRIIIPLINEAMHVLMEGVATADDIDKAMKLGFGFHSGPLSMADMMGLDELLFWMNSLLSELADHKYNACPLLRKMVRAGHLGVKSGRGFFRYDSEGNRIPESV